MNIYKLIGVIAVACVLGTSCKKDEVKNAEPKPEPKKVEFKEQPKTPCGTVWFDVNGGGHWIPCR